MNVLPVLFFVSGATGLVYQSIWARELHLVFGTSQFAIATVLAAFMGGLAIGGAWMTSRIHQERRPLRTYALLEAIIGLYALAFPWILAAVEPAYLAVGARLHSPLAFGLTQFALLGATLVLPTACMGATLPLLVRHLAPGAADAGAAVGRLYAINTAGAVFGTWAAGFWLLPSEGVRATTIVAAVGNLALAGAAAWLDRGATDRAPTSASAAGSLPGWLLASAAVAGFASLSLEVAWFRLLSLVLGASTYAFSVMLLAFLTGIALGGQIGGQVADRAARSALGVRGALALTLAGTGALVWLGMWTYGHLPMLFVQLWFQIEGMDSFLWIIKCLVAGVVMVPPAIGMGMAFPLMVRIATEADPARPAGGVYAANTLGSLAGAFVAGFVLLPTAYVTGTVLTCVALMVGNAAAVGASAHPRARAPWAITAIAAAILLVVAPPPWNPMIMSSGVYKYVDNFEEPTWAELERRMIERYDLLWYREGLSTVVTVARNRVTGNIWLANNGKIDASTTTDMPTQVLVAHTPFLFTERRARRATLIGLASGITLGALNLHPELTQIDVIELEPSMPDAARLFTRWNRDALSDPRVRLIGNDARNQLLITPPGTYDIVIAEPSNPWLTGVSNLFTREFFEMGKTRLAPGGVWSQWVQMYGMDGRDLRSILRTFCEVYPHVAVFSTIRDADLVMVGSDAPLPVDLARARALVDKTNGVEAEMLSIGVVDGYDLLSHFLFDRDTALAVAADAPINTDDNLLVEFSAPKNLHRETSGENFLMLLPAAEAPLEGIPDADGLLRLAQAYEARDDTVRALIALKEAEAREPGRADVLALWNTYQRRLAARLK